jgi:hypothetical protein
MYFWIAALANASSTESMTDSLEIECATSTNHRHCEERSDEAIHFGTIVIVISYYLRIT